MNKTSQHHLTLKHGEMIKIGEHEIRIFADKNNAVAILFSFWHSPINLSSASLSVSKSKRVSIGVFPLANLVKEMIPIRIKDEVLLLANADVLSHEEIYRISVDYNARTVLLSLCKGHETANEPITDHENVIMTANFN